MFRPKLLFTSLAALALGACSPQDPQAVHVGGHRQNR